MVRVWFEALGGLRVRILLGFFATFVLVLSGFAQMRALALTFDAEHVTRLRSRDASVPANVSSVSEWQELLWWLRHTKRDQSVT